MLKLITGSAYFTFGLYVNHTTEYYKLVTVLAVVGAGFILFGIGEMTDESYKTRRNF